MNIRFAVVSSLVAAISVLTVADSRSDEPVKVEKPAPDPMLGRKVGQVRDDNGLNLKLVWCLSGLLTMEQGDQIKQPSTKDNDADEDDPNDVKVLLTKGFWLGKYEVTQSEWKQVMKT